MAGARIGTSGSKSFTAGILPDLLKAMTTGMANRASATGATSDKAPGMRKAGVQPQRNSENNGMPK